MSTVEYPPTETQCLDDGCIRVCVGNQVGTVSSFHLVEPKVNQLRAAWLAKRSAEL